VSDRRNILSRRNLRDIDATDGYIASWDIRRPAR
jgi:hypothetical protein